MPGYFRSNKPRTGRPSRIYNIIVNPQAARYSKAKVNLLIEKIISGGDRYFLSEPETAVRCTEVVKKIVDKKPFGIIACGGDGTVSLIGRNLLRRQIGLGIFPLGAQNNIYRSLYGEVDTDVALTHIFSREIKKIDCGMADEIFFMGSLGVGFIPELQASLSRRHLPRLALGWSRLAAQAASAIPLKQISLKIDAFGFEITPQLLNINLLPYCTGLNLSPASVGDDGKCEIIFDAGKKKAIMSGYIRQIYKKKYLYSDEIRIFRGERITLSNIAGCKLYVDGEIIDSPKNELAIETCPGRIRIFQKSSGKNGRP